MIFKPEFVAKVLAGEKTQTRRPVKWAPGDLASLEDPLPCFYKEGSEYAIQPGRGQPSVGRLRVLEVTRVFVTSIDSADAHAEGFLTPVEFLDWWHGFYGHVRGECWRIRFELA